MTPTDATVAAVRLMARMQSGGGSFAQLLPAAQEGVPEAERARLQALCYGLARFGPQLQALVAPLLGKPLRRKDADVYWLLQLGVFQLQHTRMAPHAAVDSVVRAATTLGKPWAKGLVNAVLRRYQREAAALWEALDAPARAAHPDWWYDALQNDWPDDLEALLRANNAQGPMSLRVNLARQSRAEYRHRLAALDIAAQPHPIATAALVLAAPVAVSRLPGFAEGHASVQDPAAQLTVDCLRALTASGGRLLDACAAPGGKCAHALETGHWREVVALDVDAARLQRVRETLERLDVQATVQQADATATRNWWDGQPFDAILVDAPCSGSGVIRRHPDIKLLRRAADLDELAATQRRLLQRLWPLLKPGGLLLYATCSVLKRENEQQVQTFVHDQRDVTVLPLPAGPPGSAELAGSPASPEPGVAALPAGPDDADTLLWGQRRADHARQILTGEHDMDGFFLAALQKRA